MHRVTPAWMLTCCLGCSAAGSDGSFAAAPDAGASLFDAPGGLDAVPGSDGAPALVGEVYAHSDKTLYKLEPFSKAVSVVGDFDCLIESGVSTGMWDIAVDKNGVMVGTASAPASSSLVRIVKESAHCEVIATAPSLPNSLAFVPAGTLDPSEEALVGFDHSKYVRIDKATGAVQTIGSLNPNDTSKSWESSGDIVSIIGDKTYATVKPLLGGTTYGTDTLVEIDPVTGRALAELGDTGYYGLWGLGYWGGLAYGFSQAGELCEIDLSTGKGAAISLSNLPAGLSFWGAGVTTAAPVKMPK
jgi:hypothetical protein